MTRRPMEIFVWIGSALALFVVMQIALGKLRPSRPAGPERPEPENPADALTLGNAAETNDKSLTLLRDEVEVVLRLEDQTGAILQVLDAQERALALIPESSGDYAQARAWFSAIFGESLDIAIPPDADASPAMPGRTLLWRKSPEHKKINASFDEDISLEDAAEFVARGFNAWPGAGFERTAYITPLSLAWDVPVNELLRLGVIGPENGRLATLCPVRIGALTLDKGALCVPAHEGAESPLKKLELQLHLGHRNDLALKKLRDSVSRWRGLAANGPAISVTLNQTSRRIRFSVLR